MLSPSKRPRVDRNVVVPSIDDSNIHFLFGKSIPSLPKGRLVTKLEVINFVRHLKECHPKKRLSDGDWLELYQKVAEELVPLYNSAYIPTFNMEYSAKALRKNIQSDLADVSRDSTKLKKNENLRASVLGKLKKFFQFSRCQCFLEASSPEAVTRTGCSCRKADKIPCLAFFRQQMFDGIQPILFCEEDKHFFLQFMEGK